MNNGVIILSYCEIDELHLLFLPLKPQLTQCSSAQCTADLCILHTAGRQVQRTFEPGHYRAHFACSSKVWQLLESFQQWVNPVRRFFGFAGFHFSSQQKELSKELLGLMQKVSSPPRHGTFRAVGTTANIESRGMSPCFSAPFPLAPPRSSSLDIIFRFLSKRFLIISFCSCRKQS